MIRPEQIPPRLPGARRRGIRSIPEIARRRLPSIYVDDATFLVDRIGLIDIGRHSPISDVPSPLQVGMAAQWLDEAEPIQTPSFSSYKLKHAAEAWAGGYISNGAMILAAHLAGFSIRRHRANSLNVSIGIATRWLRTRPEAWCMGLYRGDPFPVANLDN